MNGIIIDPELESLIPPLAEDEYARLEESILAEGCRDALVLWNNILVDGHNRYAICKKHGLDFRTIQHEFEDKDSAKLWMMHNQLARRNLTDLQRIAIVRKCEPAVKAKAEARMTAGKTNPREKLPKGRATDELGELAGVSRKTYEHAVTVLETAPESVVKAATEEKLSINKAYQVTQATEEQQAEIADRLEHIEDEPEETNTPDKVVNDVLKPHVSFNSGNNEWYTPADYIELAKKVIGSIDLDPASNAIANETVRANKYYTAQDDGLTHDWYGNVWLNPPYASNLIGKFANKLVSELPNISNALVLVNNATETEWFKTLVSKASAVCFPYSRVKFYTPGGKIGQPLQGQAILYFGAEAKTFVDVFSAKGWCAYPA